MKIHPSITHDRLVKAVEEGMCGIANPGFCIACGEDADGCEPDAEEYTCEACGEPAVYGAEQLMFYFAF